MNNSEVAHEWAAQAKSRGRGSNFFFEGKELYSYGRHYCAARLVDVNSRLQVAFINSTNYSPSTGRHVSLARMAVNHLETFEVSNPSGGDYVLQDAFDRYERLANECFASAKRARSPWSIRGNLREALGHVEKGNRFLKLFRKKFPSKRRKITDFPADDVLALTRKAELAGAREAERSAAARLEREAQAAMNEQDWIEGRKTGALFGRKFLLRLQGEVENLKVETSHGARVPVNEAEVFYKILMRVRRNGYELNGAHGARVGSFRLDSVSEHGARVGCHLLEWDEIDRFAKAMQWEAK
jgi:hypothetical protein